MTTSLSEGRHGGEYILWEAGHISRDKITVKEGEKLAAGTVLGKLDGDGKYVLHNGAASDGSEDAVAILFDAVDATEGDVEAAATTRLSEVSLGALTFKSGITDNHKAAAIAKLAATMIIVREPH